MNRYEKKRNSQNQQVIDTLRQQGGYATLDKIQNFFFNIKVKRLLYVFCILAVLGDTLYSYVQHYNEPLDGDMGESVLPLDYIQPLYHDPFGVKMLTCGEPHAAPNRYFSHRLMYVTYRNDPEMAAMREIQASPLDTVPLTGRPTGIVSWAGPTSPEASETAGRLLHLWNVTDREKRFYFPQE